MYLAEVSVENFRNLKSLTIQLHPGLNVIVGENNVGKTNLLDAIRAALGSAAVNEPIRLRKEDQFRSEDGVSTKEPIRISLQFRGLTEADQPNFLEVLNYNPLLPDGSSVSIHFEWSWAEESKRWHSRRWGGDKTAIESAIPEDILQSIPVTLLGALRDALSALVPGQNSTLARVLASLVTEDDQTELTKIIREANKSIRKAPFIKGVESRINNVLGKASGSDFGQRIAIRTAEPDFERIARSLRLVLNKTCTADDTAKKIESSDSEPELEFLEELKTNGLGFNNLLYIATILTELQATSAATLPLLLVEEPEAHLHPQLQTLLADFLAVGGVLQEQESKVQTIVTTHSPTIASHVDPKTIQILHSTKGTLQSFDLYSVD